MRRSKSVAVDFHPVYKSDGEVNYWYAKVVGNPLHVYDRSTRQAEPVAFGLVCEVRPNRSRFGEFTLVTQGYASGGRRYREFDTFSDAIEAGEKWARRRFAYLQGGDN